MVHMPAADCRRVPVCLKGMHRLHANATRTLAHCNSADRVCDRQMTAHHCLIMSGTDKSAGISGNLRPDSIRATLWCAAGHVWLSQHSMPPIQGRCAIAWGFENFHASALFTAAIGAPMAEHKGFWLHHGAQCLHLRGITGPQLSRGASIKHHGVLLVASCRSGQAGVLLMRHCLMQPGSQTGPWHQVGGFQPVTSI